MDRAASVTGEADLKQPASTDSRPIGVFDSGVGGLTVLAALRAALPQERFVYLGDTARLPYGTKSAGTVRRYAVQAARVLVERDVKALVVACNTASAVALDALEAAWPELPVFGVVGPGAIAAAHVARSRVVVLATESTISGGAYQRALLALRPTLTVEGRACPLFVTLAEEGRRDGAVVAAVVADYLQAFVVPEHSDASADAVTLLLGCTHFPILRAAIEAFFSRHARTVQVVDSAATTARAVQAARDAGRFAPAPGDAGGPRLVLCATDGADRFRRVGRFFLGDAIEDVELVDL
ncbi:MAG: Glutamate racemase [Pseudomonadota bacterium]|jgi:glutamate racemase